MDRVAIDRKRGDLSNTRDSRMDLALQHNGLKIIHPPPRPHPPRPTVWGQSRLPSSYTSDIRIQSTLYRVVEESGRVRRFGFFRLPSVEYELVDAAPPVF